MQTSHAFEGKTLVDQNPSYRGIIAILAGGVAIGTAAIFMRLAPTTPTSAGFWRVALSVPVFLAIAYGAKQRGKQKSWQFNMTMVWPMILVGFWFATDLFFWHWAVEKTTVANATLLANLASVFIVVAGFLFFRERFNRTFLIGLSLALIGAAFLVGQNASYSPEYLFGDGLGIITAIALTGYLITAAKARQTIPAHTLMLGSSLVTAVLLLPVATMQGGQIIPETIAGWAPLLGLALVTHVMGQGLIIYGLAHVSAAYGAVGLLIQPVIAAVLAWILFDEALGILHFIGGILILTGIAITQMRKSRQKEVTLAKTERKM